LKYLIKANAFMLISFFFLQFNTLWANDSDIEMIAGLSKPPFVISDEDKGMQIEIIEAAFKKNDKYVHFTYLPLSRHFDVFHNRDFDGIITLSENEKQKGICLSKPYVIYQNVVVTLADSAYVIRNIDDLASLKVAAFQNAARFIGDEYREFFKNSDSYEETADQKSQINLLFSGRVDALVIDINIFKHLLANKRNETPKNIEFNVKFSTHFLFSPRAYTAGFKSEQLCQQFDMGIQKIIADGSYQKIIDSYLL
jgi:polar amino acid transport system substrate-binding protein